MSDNREEEEKKERRRKRKEKEKKDPPVVLHFDHPDGFNPAAKFYRAPCVHVKTFTIMMGVFEIFIICFLLVAILPDVTTRVCEKMNNETEFNEPLINFDISNIKNVTYVSSILCNNNSFYLGWAFVQVVTVTGVFYGIKDNRYWLFFPHFLFRIISIICIATFEIWLIYASVNDPESPLAYIPTIIILTLGELLALYASYVEIKCCYFAKRSRDTGFSISVARPITQATISNSDVQPEGLDELDEQQPRRLPKLPPLRIHQRQQYIIPDDPLPGNPHATSD